MSNIEWETVVVDNSDDYTFIVEGVAYIAYAEILADGTANAVIECCDRHDEVPEHVKSVGKGILKTLGVL